MNSQLIKLDLYMAEIVLKIKLCNKSCKEEFYSLLEELYNVYQTALSFLSSTRDPYFWIYTNFNDVRTILKKCRIH